MLDMNAIKNLFDAATLETANLSTIIMDAGTQQRAKMDSEAVENYTHAMVEEGSAKRFPAIKLVQLTHELTMPDGSTIGAGAFVLVDGFHRVEAANNAKLTEFQAFIVEGTIEEAVYYSMQANSTNGVNLKGKDYQNAIKKLYKLNDYWREHGRKKEIAQLFGCSSKTVERACKAIDKEIKAGAFQLFKEGKDNQAVADFAHKDVKTIQRWREEWEASQPKDDEPQGDTNEGTQGTNEDPEVDPMDLTFAQVLKLKNSELKAKLLKLLMDSIKGDSQGTEEPQQEEPEQPQQEEPKASEDATEEPQGDTLDPMQALFDEWDGKDCWTILGTTRATLDGLKNPKAAFKRVVAKATKRCHADKYGDSPMHSQVNDLLMNAIAEARKYYK